MGARWVYCRNGNPECSLFAAATTGPTPTWKDVGVYDARTSAGQLIFAVFTP